MVKDKLFCGMKNKKKVNILSNNFYNKTVPDITRAAKRQIQQYKVK